MATEEEIDLNNRLANVEFWHIAVNERLAALEEKLALAAQTVTSLEADRDDHRKRVDAAEHAPAEAKAHLDTIEKRLRAVEGAVGSSAYKHPKAKGHG